VDVDEGECLRVALREVSLDQEEQVYILFKTGPCGINENHMSEQTRTQFMDTHTQARKDVKSESISATRIVEESVTVLIDNHFRNRSGHTKQAVLAMCEMSCDAI